LKPRLTSWRPLEPGAVPAELGDVARWWIAGGWALDLFVGEQTRPHGDLDVVLLRSDQSAVHARLTARRWRLYAAVDGTLVRWTGGPLPQRVHDVWCHREGSDAWSLQLMLLDHDGEDWVFRRDRRIRGTLTELGTTAGELPILALQVQLLFKATSTRRPKDDADATVVIPRLTDDARGWLHGALYRCDDLCHNWLTALRGCWHTVREPTLTAFVTASEAEGHAMVRRLVSNWSRNRFDRPGEVALHTQGAVGGLNVDPYLDDPSVARVRHLYVHPDHRGQGLATALVRFLQGHASGFGFDRVRVRTDEAGAFYERLGFTATDAANATHTWRP
jgi:GNAT superfamily N-acetyltransferase